MLQAPALTWATPGPANSALGRGGVTTHAISNPRQTDFNMAPNKAPNL